jgi:hypothetical protein
LNVADGESVGRLKEKINSGITAGSNGHKDNYSDPGQPNNPFYEISFGYLFASGRKDGLLTPGARTNPAAKPSAKEKRTDKHKQKYDKTAINNTL